MAVRRKGKVIALGALVLLTSSGVSLPSDAPGASDSGEKKGYWWYRSDPAVEEQPVHPDLSPPPSDGALAKMHPKDVEKMIDDYRAYALWKMTPEHVTWYYRLQDFARRRSQAFMNVTQYVMVTDASLNMQTEYPQNAPGLAAREATYNTSIAQLLDRERGSAALIELSRKSCPYCQAQHNALLYFQQKHGWDVKDIDIDQHPEIKARFSVDYTPTTVVIFRGSDKWFPVSVGVESVTRIEQNLYQALRLLRGETDAQSFSLQDYQDGGLLDPQGVKQ